MLRGLEIEEGIDRAWLDAQARRNPLEHAYAVWDLERAPTRVRFVSWRREGEVRAYLLIWYGNPAYPVVHWVGSADPESPLLSGFPPRPLLAIVPPGVAEAVRRRVGPSDATAVEMMLRPSVPPLSAPEGISVRPLTPEDGETLRALARAHPGLETSAYAGLDLREEWVWGAFGGRRLYGVARAAVRLPRVWILSGVFVIPEARGRGFGRALTAVATEEALKHGAAAALMVQSENRRAVRLYEGLGYRPVDRRIWIDATRDPAASAP